MIPSLNIDAPIGEFINRVKKPGENLRAYEMGSMELADPSGGLEQQLWTADCFDGKNVYISSRATGRFLLIPNAGEAITNIDLAFDQNMHPFLAWEDKGKISIYWYDPTVPGFIVETFDARMRSPRCTLDDKREFNISNSDIVFTYIRDDTQRICARIQRDRYLIEYDLISAYDVPGVAVTDARDLQIRAVNFAMTLRLQWAFDVLRNEAIKGPVTRTTQSSAVETI